VKGPFDGYFDSSMYPVHSYLITFEVRLAKIGVPQEKDVLDRRTGTIQFIKRRAGTSTQQNLRPGLRHEKQRKGGA
jgi:hypothetical protein